MTKLTNKTIIATILVSSALATGARLYFRIGYATCLVFPAAAASFLTLTYFLAIQTIPSLAFLQFWMYCSIAILLGMFIATRLGYIHY